MFSRRQLRIIAMQALYAFFTGVEKDIGVGEKNLRHGIEKVYQLYVFFLHLLIEVHNYSIEDIEKGKNKRLPTHEDLNPDKKFISNQLLVLLSTDKGLNKQLEKYGFNVKLESDFAKRLFLIMKKSDHFKDYLADTNISYIADREFLISAFKKNIASDEVVRNLAGEDSVYWEAHYDLACSMVIKSLAAEPKSQPADTILFNQSVVAKEDLNFITDLYRKTIKNSEEYGQLVGEKAKNWDEERIAIMDILLMKMAICEMLDFPSIPIKVTINEYLDISKMYSSRQSKVFINGILDKLLTEFKEKKKLNKRGRGLIDS